MARIHIPDGAGEERERMWALRPELAVASQAFSNAVQQHSILSVPEHEAARIRIAHINGCQPCTDARVADMESVGISEVFYRDVDDPTRRRNYSPREVLCIEFAERFCAGADGFNDDFWRRLNSEYSAAAVVDLAASCAKWLGMGRMTAVLEIAESCPIRLVPGATHAVTH